MNLYDANCPFLNVSRTGLSSADLRQSYRVHPVYEAKKPHAPAGYRRPEAAKRTAGAARYFRSTRPSWCSEPPAAFSAAALGTLLIFHSCVDVVFSPRPGKGEGLHSAPGQLSVVWQQTVHQLQRYRRVGIRRGLRPELRVRSRRASQQEEAVRGVQLEDPRAFKSWPRSGQQGRKSEMEHCRGWLPPSSFNTAATFIILLTSGWEIAAHHCYHHDRLHSQEVSTVEAAASVHWKSFSFRPLSSPFFSFFFGSPPSVFTV